MSLSHEETENLATRVATEVYNEWHASPNREAYVGAALNSAAREAIGQYQAAQEELDAKLRPGLRQRVATALRAFTDAPDDAAAAATAAVEQWLRDHIRAHSAPTEQDFDPSYLRVAKHPAVAGESRRQIPVGDNLIVDVAPDGAVLGIERTNGPVLPHHYLAVLAVVRVVTPEVVAVFDAAAAWRTARGPDHAVTSVELAAAVDACAVANMSTPDGVFGAPSNALRAAPPADRANLTADGPLDGGTDG